MKKKPTLCWCLILHHLHLGFVHPLQDVALHQCLPSSSICCFPDPGGSLLLYYVILPSSAWSLVFDYKVKYAWREKDSVCASVCLVNHIVPCSAFVSGEVNQLTIGYYRWNFSWIQCSLSTSSRQNEARSSIMEAMTTLLTVQPSFHHWHSTNRVSWSATIVSQWQGEVWLHVRRRW